MCVLQNSESPFDGTLGRWVGKLHEIQLKKDVEPFHAKPFSVPHAHERTLKMEIEQLVKMGVLKRVNHSECASPSFIIPRKTRLIGLQMILEN